MKHVPVWKYASFALALLSACGGNKSPSAPKTVYVTVNQTSTSTTRTGGTTTVSGAGGAKTLTLTSVSTSSQTETGTVTTTGTATVTETTTQTETATTTSVNGTETVTGTTTTTSTATVTATTTNTATSTGTVTKVTSETSTSTVTSVNGATPKTETPFVVPADAKPTPATSGKPGVFRVNEKGHLTNNGAEFQIRGGNWFGLEGQDDVQRPGAMELYIGSTYWGSSKRTIEQTMKEIKAAPLSFNTIRFPIAPQTLVPNHPDGLYSRQDVKIMNNDPSVYPYTDAYSVLEDFILQADKNGLYVILDMHSCSNHIGWRAGKIDDGPPWVDANRENYKYKKENYTCKSGEDAYDKAKWLADIHTLAKLPKKLGVKNIIGIDCFNEPYKYSWGEWADLSKECYDAIAAEDDDLIAIIEGISGSHENADGTSSDEPYGDVTTNPNWGENLYGQQFDPIQIPKDRLCFSPHTYGPAVYVQRQFIEQTPECAWLEDDAAGKAKCKLVVERGNQAVIEKMKKGWDTRFGYLHEQGYCVVIGEFGGHTGWPFNNPVKPQAATIWSHASKSIRYDLEWQNIFVDYLIEKQMTDFLYWSINPESGDTGGLYKHAYTLQNESGWGTWQGLDSEKGQLLQRLK